MQKQSGGSGGGGGGEGAIQPVIELVLAAIT